MAGEQQELLILKEFIAEYFQGDDDIFEYFDPFFKVNTIDEISENIAKKILEYAGAVKCKLCSDHVGYMFYITPALEENMLVSFCIKKEYRTKQELKKFWGKIQIELGEGFKCVLYTKNTRAIKWLKKCGMKEMQKDDLLTILYF